MRQRLIGKLSRNLRSLINGGAGNEALRAVDIATLGLMERVREEWETRQRPRVDTPFDLRQMLRLLDRGNARQSKDEPEEDDQRRPRRLPERRLDRDGRVRPVDDAFFARREYSVHDLTHFADAVFVEIAYRCVLKRPPDPIGFRGFLTPLRQGTSDRVDVLHALRTSVEGSQQKVAIRGLRVLVFLRRSERVPLIGPIIGWIRALVALRRIAGRVRMLEGQMEARYQELSQRFESSFDSGPGRNNEAIVALERSQVRVETAVVALADRYHRLLLEVEARETARTSRGDPGASLQGVASRSVSKQ